MIDCAPTRPRNRRWVAALLLLAFGGGCSAPKDAMFDPGAEPVFYYVSENPLTTREQRTYTSNDGATLGYIAHVGAPTNTAIIYLHGIESHAGWFDEAADLLSAEGVDVFCLDRRGSGVNRENRGFSSGHIDEYATLIADVGAFIDHIGPTYDRIFLTGLSWGGKLALGCAVSDPAELDGVILITPGLKSKVDIAFTKKLRVLGASVGSGQKYVAIPIEPEMFTTTPHVLETLRADPLRLHQVTTRFLLEGRHLETLIDKRLPENRLPILLVLAGRDVIIDNDAVLELVERSGGATETLVYEDQTHSIQFDAPRRLVDDIVLWLDEH